MRTFPNTVLSRALAAQSAQPVQFLRFAFGGGDIRLCTAPYDVDWDGFTWQGIGGFLRLNPVSESPDDRGGQFGLELSGVDQSMISAILDEAYIGRVLDVWWGWVAVGTNALINSGLETNANGYSGSGATLTRSQAVPAAEGDWCLSIALTDAAADHGVSTINNNGTDLAVTAGREYAMACRVRLADGSSPKTWRLFVDFYDAGVSYLGSTANAQQLITSGGWQELRVTGTAPATATIARPRLLNVQNQGTYTLYADAFQFGPAGASRYQPTDGAAIQEGTVLDRPLFVFSGFMNGGFEIQEEMSERNGQSVKITGRVVSRLASLTVPRGLRTNRESHQQVYRSDQFFEFVPGLANKEIIWGSKPWSIGTFVTTGQSPFRRG